MPDIQGASLDMKGVCRAFKETGLVVDNLNLSISSGEFVSLLGPSGCGKSTLLRILAGLDLPSEGEVRVHAFGAKHFRGYVFQDPHLMPWRNVVDNVALPLRLTGAPKSEAREKARMALEKVRLEDSLEKYPHQLSGGMKMRTSVARALVTNPSLLLLDEPFAALDENTRHRLQEELRSLWKSLGMTVVFVTHSVSEAVFLSTRTIVLSKRPARIILDEKISLREVRQSALRTKPQFVSMVEKIQSAFDLGDVSGQWDRSGEAR